MIQLLLLFFITIILFINNAAANYNNNNNNNIQLHLIPHTHCDVGWLETTDALARMNVSRILDGVVANLQNGSIPSRRRFVWDEMAFLSRWWADEKTSDEQRNNFVRLVKNGQIELADNGWSQHDMGATTVNSMLANWDEGHQWLKKHGLPRPKIGWSLDPFGISSTQATLQSLMGFDAWFFTRISANDVASRKQDKSLEFIWQSSSSLPIATTEIFAHVFESYYCMPLPTYAFEWGPPLGGAPPPPWNDTYRLYLSENLANITKGRAGWFRTPNVLIPWGCDYQYQNAALVYDATDILIDTINQHPEWGVDVRYSTPSEYLMALQQDETLELPIKKSGNSFFPYVPNPKQGAWSGYFTSRPILKGASRVSENLLHAAEILYIKASNALSNMMKSDLWNQLEISRQGCGIVQHHDAITGTECRKEEGCSGTNQVVGSHDVLGDYLQMLKNADKATSKLFSTIFGPEDNDNNNNNNHKDDDNIMPTTTNTDPTILGNLLLSGERGRVIVYNPLSKVRNAIVKIPVPVCNVQVFSVTKNGKKSPPILSQVTAALSVPSTIAPYYDFEVTFEETFSPLSEMEFIIAPYIGGCGGGDYSKKNTYVEHDEIYRLNPKPLSMEQEVVESFYLSKKVSKHIETQKMMMGEVLVDDASSASTEIHVANNTPKPPFSIENNVMKLYFSTTKGLDGFFNKKTNTNYTIQHDLVLYKTGTTNCVSDAYKFCPLTYATPILDNVNASVLTTSVAEGDIMSEVRLQLSNEHKIFYRIWQSTDEGLANRIEVAVEAGVLLERTELASRFYSKNIASTNEDTVLIAEENGYEKLSHQFNSSLFNGVASLLIAGQYYPSQMSVSLYGKSSKKQLSIALDRAKGVSTLAPGTLEIMHHRRTSAFDGQNSIVALDDVDRIHTEMFLFLGDLSEANDKQVEMKLDLNTPLVYTYTSSLIDVDHHDNDDGNKQDGELYSLPFNVRLQTVRATSSEGNEMIIRLRHLFAVDDVSTYAKPVDVNLGKFLCTTLLGGGKNVVLKSIDEMTLNAYIDLDDLKRLKWNTTKSIGMHVQENGRMATSRQLEVKEEDTDSRDGDDDLCNKMITLNPLEIRTFLVEV
jgi:hypothetical protein